MKIIEKPGFLEVVSDDDKPLGSVCYQENEAGVQLYDLKLEDDAPSGVNAYLVLHLFGMLGDKDLYWQADVHNESAMRFYRGLMNRGDLEITHLVFKKKKTEMENEI